MGLLWPGVALFAVARDGPKRLIEELLLNSLRMLNYVGSGNSASWPLSQECRIYVIRADAPSHEFAIFSDEGNRNMSSFGMVRFARPASPPWRLTSLSSKNRKAATFRLNCV